MTVRAKYFSSKSTTSEDQYCSNVHLQFHGISEFLDQNEVLELLSAGIILDISQWRNFSRILPDNALRNSPGFKHVDCMSQLELHEHSCIEHCIGEGEQVSRLQFCDLKAVFERAEGLYHNLDSSLLDYYHALTASKGFRPRCQL